MERGCSIHVLECLDKLPRKKCFFKLKTKFSMVSLTLWKVKINALAKKIHKDSLLHTQFDMINEEYFKFIF